MNTNLNELLLRWHELRSRGQSITIDELCRDHPELAPEVAKKIHALESMLVVAPTGPYEPPEHHTPPPSHPSSDAHFTPGFVLAGRYRIVSRLGKGGMGEVYRADDLRLGQSVALKFLPDDRVRDPERIAALHDEVKLARQISHANVCRVYDIGEADGHTFLSMEFVDGEDLASLLRRIGRLPPDKGVEIARQLCLGLAAAHEKGVIHRDLKPANVMIDGRGHVRITDFGIARLTASVTGPEARAGTPAYMAPEQLAGKEVTLRSDIYALGLVLYEIFTGKKAFHAATPLELAKLQEQSSPPSPSSHVSELDPTIERVIQRCLEFDPRNRPASALAVASALPGGDPLAAALAAGELPSPEVVAAASDAGVWPTTYAAVCLASVIVTLILCVLLYPQGTLIGQVGVTKSTEVLTERARTILKDFESPDDKDSAVGFDHDEAYLKWIQENDKSPTRWDRLGRAQPAALYFWYRRSPKYLVPDLYYPYQGTLEPGRITLAEPPPVISGMVSVKLDLQGRLLELHAVPPELELDANRNAATDWDKLFEVAGLKMKDFKEVEPGVIPLSFAKERRAWTGHLPDDPEFPVRIEAASLNGGPVFFQIRWQWTKREQNIGAQGTLDWTGTLFSALLFIAVLVSAVLLAPHNWRHGRADRRGAFRLAFASFVILMIVWAFETHHVPSIDELRLFVLGLAYAGYWSGLLWLTYVALEPFVRRLWPECLITWTRLLSGQWRDGRLGRDVLIGVLLGLAMQVVDLLGRIVPGQLGSTAPVPYWDWWLPNTFVPGYWTGNFLINLIYSFRWAFFFNLLLLLVLRGVLRHIYLAGPIWVVVSTASWLGSSAGFDPSFYWLFAIAIYVLSLCVLVRVGVLALIVGIFVWYTVSFPLTMDPTCPYAQGSLMAIGSVLLLAGYGFYVSLGGRSLFAMEK